MTRPLQLAPAPLGATSLFLDLDGTIAPLCGSPGEVVADPRRTGLLREAGQKLAGRVAIVSGRTLASIDAITGGACTAAAGVHGLQRRTATGDVEHLTPSPRVLRAAERMAAFALGDPGLLVEYKGQSAALHYRGAPKAEAAVMEFIRRLADVEALQIQPGAMVMELRMPGPDKGAAVRAFMTETPFRGTRPVYVGDDLTDESAFAEVAAQGGVGVLVGRDRPTAATARLESVADVLHWLSGGLARGAFTFEERLRWAA